MANRFWGINKGGHYGDVVEQASSPTKDVEVNLNLASGLTRLEIILALNYIMQAILKDIWPPA